MPGRRITPLAPRVGTLDSRTSDPTPIATERTRGRMLQRNRARWFFLRPLCVKCEERGRVTSATELDHIQPLFLGGRDDETNWQGLCKSCHREKTAVDMQGIGARPGGERNA